jgi:hypothetical protein
MLSNLTTIKDAIKFGLVKREENFVEELHKQEGNPPAKRLRGDDNRCLPSYLHYDNVWAR